MARFACHCTTCQDLFQAPYADITALWSRHLTVADGAGEIEWVRRHLLPASVKRGLCRACGKPVLGRLQFPMPGVTMVAASNWAEGTDLPTPSGHIFYHRRVAEVDDGLPKVSGMIQSELAVTSWLLPKLLNELGRR